MEKFVVKKSVRYFAQNERLCLPALELIYVWNCIRIMGKDWALIQNSYRLIERSFRDIEKRKNGNESDFYSQKFFPKLSISNSKFFFSFCREILLGWLSSCSFAERLLSSLHGQPFTSGRMLSEGDENGQADRWWPLPHTLLRCRVGVPLPIVG